MANYNKSFNFRNGVQVDEDNFLVASTGLVGIGTTIPRYDLDVYGNTNVVGLITSKNLVVSGIASFTEVIIGTGITIYGNTGIISATFYGDGSNLFGVPTSQWVDVDVGLGFTSIYAAGNVGVATTNPSRINSLQIGGSPELGQSGVGINSIGNIRASGIITSSYFDGDGSSLTNLNASNISSGTISNSRLPSNILVGFVSATNFLSGVSTVGFLTASNAYLGVATVGFSTISNLYSGIGTIVNFSSTLVSIGETITSKKSVTTTGIVTNLTVVSGIVTSLTSTFSNSGVGTVGIFTATHANIGVATISTLYIQSGITSSLTSEYANIGIATVGFSTATYSNIGISTASKINVSNVQIAVSGNTEIDTVSGELVLDSNSGTVRIDDRLIVTGISTLQGSVTVETGIVPDVKNGAYLGSSALPFSDAYISSIRIGYAGVTEIDTTSGNLILTSQEGFVNVNDNFYVSGISTLTGEVTLNTGIVPDVDFDSYIGSNTKSFTNAYIGDIRIGTASSNTITTRSKELILDSNSGNTKVNDNLTVTGFTSITGGALNVSSGNIYSSGIISAFSGFLPFDNQTSPLGSSTKKFSEVYVDNINIGVGSDNKIASSSGDIQLSPSSGVVDLVGQLKVSNGAIISGVTTVNSSLVPNVDITSNLGSLTKAFSQSYLNGITVGVAGTTTISTRGGNLVLDSSTDQVVVNNNLQVIEELTVNGSFVVETQGGSNIININATDSVIGIGTTNPYVLSPNSNLLIYDTVTSQLDLYSTSSTGESAIQFITNGGVEGRLGFSTSGDFTLKSNDPRGNISFILNNSAFSGISSGNFYWENEYYGNNLATLTWDGKFGVNNDEPQFTLDVVGTSSITDNSYFGNNVTISGNLIVNGTATFSSGITLTNDSLPNIITKNINVTSGVSTFNTIHSNIIGIGTTTTGLLLNLVDIDAKNSKALFQSIGIGTTGITENTYSDVGLLISGKMIVDSSSYIGIGTTTKFYPGGDPEFITPSGLEGDIQIFDSSVDLYKTYVNIYKQSSVGFNTDLPRGVLDFGYADDTADFYPVVILPNINDTARNGIGDTATGAVIFNTSSNTFQGWNGSAWVNFY
jgi:hypothetical protein